MSLPLVFMPAGAAPLAEALMVDSASVTRAGALIVPIVVDPVTGLAARSADVVVYSGKCRRYSRILPRAGQLQKSAADTVVGIFSYVSVPLSAPLFAVEDVVTVTACPGRLGDVGLKYRVLNLVKNTQASAQRVQVEAVVD